MQNRQTASQPIVLHPKQKIESELKWQTCFGTMPCQFSCSSGEGLRRAGYVSNYLLRYTLDAHTWAIQVVSQPIFVLLTLEQFSLSSRWY